MTQILRNLLSQSRRNADIPVTCADHQLIGFRLWRTRMRELIDKPLMDDAIDAYVDCGRSAPQFGMSTSGGRAVRRPIPRWRRRVGGHRDG
jgi:hypothetical protein